MIRVTRTGISLFMAMTISRCWGNWRSCLGPIPMIPRYILGTWVGSRAGYSADEWKMIGNEFREKHVPADIFVFDSMFDQQSDLVRL